MLSNMETNKVTPEEARAALESVNGIEQSARSRRTPLWTYAILGILFGVTVAGSIMQWTYWWALFAVVIITCIGFAVWEHNSNVRPSVKQPVPEQDPPMNWAAVIAPALIMPLVWFVPEGSVIGATIAGIVAAVVTTGFMVYGDTQR